MSDTIMVDSSKPFLQARLKHVWADEHTRKLNFMWQAFLESDFCEVRLEDDLEGGHLVQAFFSKCPPINIALTLGDVIHNLRCALDYAVSELLGWKDTRLTFPMGEAREELVDSFRVNPELRGGRTVKKGRNAAIETAVPGIANIILERVKPYKGGNGFLWVINKLDGRDKHRLLLPLLIPRSIPEIYVVYGDNQRMRISNGTISHDSIPMVNLRGIENPKIEKYGKATAEMFFNEPGIIEMQPVLPTLVQMSQAVSETIDLLGEFALSVGWKPPKPSIELVPDRSSTDIRAPV